MDKKFLKEHGLIDAHKQFVKLYEYTYITSNDLTNEDDDDQADEQPDEGDNMPPQMNDLPDNADNFNDSQNDGSNELDMPDNSNVDNTGDGETNDGVEGLNVSDDDTSQNADDNVSTQQEGDEVIDVDDLTKAQEDSDDKIKMLNVKFDKILSIVDRFDSLLDQNNAKIDDLKADIERRNPTQIEKLTMRAQNSYPFNVTPDEYWREKEANSNYRIEDDENGEEQGQYVITKNDIDGDTDWRTISKSLDDDDLHPTIHSIFNN